jgi:hypothetical protein
MTTNPASGRWSSRAAIKFVGDGFEDSSSCSEARARKPAIQLRGDASGGLTAPEESIYAV